MMPSEPIDPVDLSREAARLGILMAIVCLLWFGAAFCVVYGFSGLVRILFGDW